MRLFIRTEASSQIGLGHFMRCFAIAEEARERGIPVTFVLNEIGEAVQTRLAAIGAEGVVVAGPPGTAQDIMALSGLGLTHIDWLLIDSYAAPADYLTMQQNVARVAVIDDLNALERYDCNLLINPAQAARAVDYERKTRARLLLGADYALIRKEFLRTSAPEANGFIAVMFGGSDPLNLSGQCVQKLHDALPETKIKVIAGPANVHTKDLILLEQKFDLVEIISNPVSVSAELSGAGLVLTAAGGTIGELAAMALPALVLVVYDNQAAALKACPYPAIDARGGLPADLGDQAAALIDDPARRAAIARHAHAVVDGHGPRRIVEALQNV